MRYFVLVFAILLVGCTPADKPVVTTTDVVVTDAKLEGDNFAKNLTYVGQARGYDLYVYGSGNGRLAFQFPTAGLPSNDVRPVNRDDINGYIYGKVDEKNIDAVRAKLKILEDLSSQVYDERDRLERLLKGE